MFVGIGRKATSDVETVTFNGVSNQCVGPIGLSAAIGLQTKKRPYVTFRNKIRILNVRYRENNVRVWYAYAKCNCSRERIFWYYPSLSQQ